MKTNPSVNKKRARSLALFMVTLMAALLPLMASAEERPEMADVMRSNGKIYIVILVICTIFIGITLFLISLERRIRKMERSQR